jgi:hypothetical protein
MGESFIEMGLHIFCGKGFRSSYLTYLLWEGIPIPDSYIPLFLHSVGGDSDPRSYITFYISYILWEGIPILVSYISSIGGDSNPRSFKILFHPLVGSVPPW